MPPRSGLGRSGGSIGSRAASSTTRLAAGIVDPPLSIGREARDALLARAQDQIDRCMSIAMGRHHMFGMLISARLGIDLSVLVGAFAEQLYLRRHPRLPPLSPMDLPSLAELGDVAQHMTYLFANCLIDRDAAAVDRLLRTRVQTDEENSAFAALSVHFAGCLDQGSSLALNQVTLRTALADQLYRRAR